MKKNGIITILTILVLLAVASVAICNEEKSLRGTLYRNITPNHTETTFDSSTPSESNYRLSFDSPLILNKETLSEQTIVGVGLNVPTDLQEKATKLVGNYVVVKGFLDCTMRHNDWRVLSRCMTVKKIDKATFFDRLFN